MKELMRVACLSSEKTTLGPTRDETGADDEETSILSSLSRSHSLPLSPSDRFDADSEAACVPPFPSTAPAAAAAADSLASSRLLLSLHCLRRRRLLLDRLRAREAGAAPAGQRE